MAGDIHSVDMLVITMMHNQGEIEEENTNFDHDTQNTMQPKAYVVPILEFSYLIFLRP